MSLTRVIISIAWLLMCVSQARAAGQAAAPTGALALKACTVPGNVGRARCGTYEVWENRGTRSGRKLTLRVAELLALDTPVAAQPIVAFGGGPGEAVASNPQGYANLLSAVRRNHNVLLVDQRGTADQHRLSCELPRGRAIWLSWTACFPIV